jgi:hypothetical protein
MDDLRLLFARAKLSHLHLVEGATMYELLGALAFTALLVSQVLAVLFIRHDLTDEGSPSFRQDVTPLTPGTADQISPG